MFLCYPFFYQVYGILLARAVCDKKYDKNLFPMGRSVGDSALCVKQYLAQYYMSVNRRSFSIQLQLYEAFPEFQDNHLRE
jgi:hypothetical protein